MSQFSSAYDALMSLVQTTLPNHKELINPYTPEINDELTYDAAWGLAIAEAQNTNRVVGCEMSIERSVMVTVSRKIMAGTLNRNAETIAARRTTEKNLFEDLELVIEAFEKSPTVNNSNPIVKTVYEGDSGLEFVRTERHDLIMVRAVFKMEYFKALT